MTQFILLEFTFFFSEYICAPTLKKVGNITQYQEGEPQYLFRTSSFSPHFSPLFLSQQSLVVTQATQPMGGPMAPNLISMMWSTSPATEVTS